MSYNPYAVTEALGGGTILTHKGTEIGVFDDERAAAVAAADDAISAHPEATSDFLADRAAVHERTVDDLATTEWFRDHVAEALLEDWGVATAPRP